MHYFLYKWKPSFNLTLRQWSMFPKFLNCHMVTILQERFNKFIRQIWQNSRWWKNPLVQLGSFSWLRLFGNGFCQPCTYKHLWVWRNHRNIDMNLHVIFIIFKSRLHKKNWNNGIYCDMYVYIYSLRLLAVAFKTLMVSIPDSVLTQTYSLIVVERQFVYSCSYMLIAPYWYVWSKSYYVWETGDQTFIWSLWRYDEKKTQLI